MKLKTRQLKDRAIERAKSDNYERAMEVCHARLTFIVTVLSLCFVVLLARLFYISLSNIEDLKIEASKKIKSERFTVKRADIYDTNGEILATNISTASAFINPKEVVDTEEAIQKLKATLPEIEEENLRKKFNPKKSFVWLKRHLTPKEQQAIHNLGIPGVNFVKDEKRIYPQSDLFAHAVGFVDVDGNGLAGVERKFNEELELAPNNPITLTLDTRIQSILKEEVAQAISLNEAEGGSGLIMDVNNGEVLALASFPDFNPHNIESASERAKFNQITLGSYEMGSVFKILTMAAGLDLKKIYINDTFDVSSKLQVANFQIGDYRGKGGSLSVPEVLMYSSNIGTAKIAARYGIRKQQEYLKRFGMLDPIDFELPEMTKPRYPSKRTWNEVSMVTISYGHGIAVTPLHLAQAISTVVNGGYLVKPTLLKTSNKPEKIRVIDQSTSELMRKLLRLVVVGGSAKKADVEGYFVGGKTGTAEKVIGKNYSKTLNLSSFIGAFPIHDPKYLVLIIVDAAKRNKHNQGFTTGGMVVAPAANKVIQRISPILGVEPKSFQHPEVYRKLELNFTPIYQPISMR